MSAAGSGVTAGNPGSAAGAGGQAAAGGEAIAGAGVAGQPSAGSDAAGSEAIAGTGAGGQPGAGSDAAGNEAIAGAGAGGQPSAGSDAAGSDAMGGAGAGEQPSAGGVGGDTVGGVGGGGSAAPDTRVLAQITTEEEARAVCARIDPLVSGLPWELADTGHCALLGLTTDVARCAEIRAACLENLQLPVTCNPQAFPVCSDVTVDEFLTCAVATITSRANYEATIACESDLSTLPAPQTPAVCLAPYARCPALQP